jgi:hypothetical protein
MRSYIRLSHRAMAAGDRIPLYKFASHRERRLVRSETAIGCLGAEWIVVFVKHWRLHVALPGRERISTILFSRTIRCACRNLSGFRGRTLLNMPDEIVMTKVLSETRVRDGMSFCVRVGYRSNHATNPLMLCVARGKSNYRPTCNTIPPALGSLL